MVLPAPTSAVIRVNACIGRSPMLFCISVLLCDRMIGGRQHSRSVRPARSIILASNDNLQGIGSAKILLPLMSDEAFNPRLSEVTSASSRRGRRMLFQSALLASVMICRRNGPWCSSSGLTRNIPNPVTCRPTSSLRPHVPPTLSIYFFAWPASGVRA